MRVEDFDSDLEVNNETELERVLNKRFDHGINGFWLHPDKDNKLPALSILVNGDLATLTYFPSEPHPGFRSMGKIEGLDPDEMSIFFLDSPTQKEEVPNEFIVPFPEALQAAKELLHSPELPSSIEWFEL